MHLTSEEASEVERRVAALEARTGAEVVAAVVSRSDHYPEIPWSAFALGASLAALAVAVVDVARPTWPSTTGVLLHGAAILGAGAVLAFATAVLPAFGRIFLRSSRAEGEVLQQAQGMFLEREVFRTPARTGVLLLASLFERRVVLVADTGLRARIGPEAWKAVVDRMTPALAAGRTAQAFLEGLGALEEVLVREGFPGAAAGATRALADRPVEEEGT
jgi:putative membrane protein